MKRLQLPLTTTAGLEAGEEVLLSGTLYTARDQAHQRLAAMLERGEPLPFDLRGAAIYYVGPTPPPPGHVIGSAGPTTSGRMDPFTPALLDHGLRAMVGKGPRSAAVVEAIRRNGAVYFIAYGGCGALYARCVRTCELVAFPELGTEAIRRLEVVDMPVLVGIDATGRDLLRDRP